MLIPIAEQWKNVGTLLELSREDLNSIAADGELEDNNSRLREMLGLWSSRVPLSTAWQTLADAVEPFNEKIAAKIMSQVQSTSHHQ